MLEFSKIRSCSKFDVFTFAVAFFSLVVFLVAVVDFSSSLFWRHDSVYYLSSYGYKVPQEGRWINYIFFHVIKLIPPLLALFSSYSLLFLFFFTAIKRYTNNAPYSFLVGVVVISTPLWFAQFEWPVTTLPALLILALIPFFYTRLPGFVFFPLASVLFFGTFSSFYFFIPLLFLNCPTKKHCINKLFFWAFSFPVGYLVANCAVFVVKGHWIEVADWRNPHPVASWPQLVENIMHNVFRMMKHLNMMFEVTSKALLLPMMVFSVLFFENRLARVMLFVSSAAALYITTIPIGIQISPRTAVVFWVPLLLLVLVVRFRSRWQSVVYPMLAAVFFGLLMMSSIEHISWYKALTGRMVSQIEQALGPVDQRTAGVKFYVDKTSWDLWLEHVAREESVNSVFSEKISGYYYWQSLLVSLGYEDVKVLESSERKDCSTLVGQHSDNPFVVQGANENVVTIRFCYLGGETL